jgi:hypothetical protein
MSVIQDTQSETALLAELGRLKAENELLKARASAKAASRISCKISDKGALSIYGLGRFPVTLYLSQFKAMDTAWPMIRDFVEDNLSKFATKD